MNKIFLIFGSVALVSGFICWQAGAASGRNSEKNTQSSELVSVCQGIMQKSAEQTQYDLEKQREETTARIYEAQQELNRRVEKANADLARRREQK